MSLPAKGKEETVSGYCALLVVATVALASVRITRRSSEDMCICRYVYPLSKATRYWCDLPSQMRSSIALKEEQLRLSKK